MYTFREKPSPTKATSLNNFLKLLVWAFALKLISDRFKRGKWWIVENKIISSSILCQFRVMKPSNTVYCIFIPELFRKLASPLQMLPLLSVPPTVSSPKVWAMGVRPSSQLVDWPQPSTNERRGYLGVRGASLILWTISSPEIVTGRSHHHHVQWLQQWPCRCHLPTLGQGDGNKTPEECFVRVKYK